MFDCISPARDPLAAEPVSQTFPIPLVVLDRG
jgi:hypothetical protein